jgi:hypothetical protein
MQACSPLHSSNGIHVLWPPWEYHSAHYPQSTGVPQGSALSPLSFLMQCPLTGPARCLSQLPPITPMQTILVYFFNMFFYFYFRSLFFPSVLLSCWSQTFLLFVFANHLRVSSTSLLSSLSYMRERTHLHPLWVVSPFPSTP